MNIGGYILRRLLGLFPLLLAISFFAFVLIQLSPSDPAEVCIRVNAMTPTPELIEEMREEMGLNKPFLERYLDWVGYALQGDFGKRYVDGKPVAGEMAKALPPTLALAGATACLMLAVSIACALAGVLFEGRWPDIVLRGFVFLLTSVPAFWAGLLFIWLFAVHLDLLPTGGLEGPGSLVLPAATLSLPYIAAYSRLLRASMVQAREQNFTLYMKACGRSGGAVMRHVFRNSLQSSLTAPA